MLHLVPGFVDDGAPQHALPDGGYPVPRGMLVDCIVASPFFRGLLVSCMLCVPFWGTVAWLFLHH